MKLIVGLLKKQITHVGSLSRDQSETGGPSYLATLYAVNDGRRTVLLKDKWLGNRSLSIKFPDLFNFSFASGQNCGRHVVSSTLEFRLQKKIGWLGNSTNV